MSGLKQQGVLREPVRYLCARKRGWQRPYGVRKPQEYLAKEPGGLVEVDTLHLRPLPGVVPKQFTARDVVSRWDVLGVHSRAGASKAAGFLETLPSGMPFTVRAMQVDGGSQFMAQFEEACRQGGIRLFVLPAGSAKLNGCVERAHGTHAEEFYQVVDWDCTIAELRGKLLEWEGIYHRVRPHQALGYLTPPEFLQCYQQNQGKEVMWH